MAPRGRAFALTGVAAVLSLAIFGAATKAATTSAWRKHQGPVHSNYPPDPGKSFTADPGILYQGGTFYMWYASLVHAFVPETAPYRGCDWAVGNARCGLALELATSKDGISWRRYRHDSPRFQDAFVLKHDSDRSWDSFGPETPSLLYDGRRKRFQMWFTATAGGAPDPNRLLTQVIGYAESRDGIHWRKHDNPATRQPRLAKSDPVLVPRRSSWDNLFVADPTVIREGAKYKLWYGGGSRRGGGTVAIGYAESSDGIHWRRRGRPVVVASTREKYLNGAHVLKVGGRYEMWYYAGAQPGVKYAVSRDGLNWTKRGFALSTGSRGSWDEGETSSPYVLVHGGRYWMYYTGSNCPMEESRRPRKDCQPHLKIGLATRPLS